MIRWADSKPRMRRNGGLFCLGDVVPDGYFTEAEIADLVSRGKITVIESRQVELVEAQAPELVEAQPDELEQPDEPDELEQHDEPDEPIDLGSETSSKPKGRPKRRRS